MNLKKLAMWAFKNGLSPSFFARIHVRRKEWALFLFETMVSV
jgi:hypothetical protein